MTTGLEDKQAIENAVSHARLGVCPSGKSIAYTASFKSFGFDEWQVKIIKFYHVVHLREHPEVECSCR